jgi:large subunit ribosomal protein L9
MEVILLEKTRNLGDLGDKVSVKSGYGRNFLIPQGKAVPATASNLAVFEQRRAELEANALENFKLAEERKAQISNLKIVIAAKSGDEGKLFGSIGTRDIAEAISKAGANLEKKEVLMPAGPIRQTGEYQIALQLHSDLQFTITLTVVAED